MIIEELNIICMNGKRYRFPTDEIKYWDFEFKSDVVRIDFKDGSFIEFNKRHIVCLEANTKEGMKGERG